MPINGLARHKEALEPPQPVVQGALKASLLAEAFFKHRPIFIYTAPSLKKG